MIRVWLANEQQHVVLNIGFWEERGINERAAWGTLIADMVGHIADAHKAEYGHDREESMAIIRDAFDAEFKNPTTARLGEFVAERLDEAEPNE